MTAKEVFNELQKIHPNYLSFTYWSKNGKSSLTINQYCSSGYTVVNQWTGHEQVLDLPTRELINKLRMELEK